MLRSYLWVIHNLIYVTELASLAFHKERQGGVRSTLLVLGVAGYLDLIWSMCILQWRKYMLKYYPSNASHFQRKTKRPTCVCWHMHTANNLTSATTTMKTNALATASANMISGTNSNMEVNTFVAVGVLKLFEQSSMFLQLRVRYSASNLSCCRHHINLQTFDAELKLLRIARCWNMGQICQKTENINACLWQ